MNASAANNRYWLLNSVNGWRKRAQVEEKPLQSAGNSLSLRTLPGQARPFGPNLTEKLPCPAAMVRDDCGRTYVLDSATNRVARIDATGAIQIIDDFGGRGSQPRQFHRPRGMTMVQGATVVCDTGNHRVQIFSPAPFALIQLWGRAEGIPGRGEKEFHRPWSVAADERGNIHIADRGNGRIQKIALDGTWLATLGAGVLTDPTELALGPNGIIAVVDGIADEIGGRVQILSSQGDSLAVLPKIERPRAVAFDSGGNLFVGTAIGLVFHFAPNPANPSNYEYVGAGVTGLEAAAVGLISTPEDGLLGIFQDTERASPRLWTISTQGSFVTEGSLVTETIDSGIEDCSWDRVTLIGTIPAGASVRVECFTTADFPDPHSVPVADPDDGPPYTFIGDSQSSSCDNPECGDPTCVNPNCGGAAELEMTCLVQACPAQYLRLRITFTSGGQSTPRLSAIKIFFPRQSYLQYLPAVYQEDAESRDFLDRFLSIFQATFDDFDAKIDSMWRLFDADSAPSKYFDWLAAWVRLSMDPTWPISKKRDMLKRAVNNYKERGTIAGIIGAISDYAGMADGIAIVEHFRLRNWPLLSIAAPLGGAGRLWGRAFYQRLQVGVFSQVGSFLLTDRPEPAAEAYDWGANEFSVFFPADPYDPDAATAKIAKVVEREKPAHTQANLVPVLPRFRVGVQATLGIDSSVGGYTQLVLGSLSRLGYDAILSCSPAQRDLETLGAAAQPITGVNTRLF